MTPDTTTGATDDEYRIVHATMHWYKKGEPRRSEYVPWWTYPFKFVDGRDATEGPDPTISITHAGALVVDTAKTYTVQVENVGDDTTFDDLIVVLTIGANSRYDDHTAVGWTVEFSINGGSSYSGTPPVDPADITHVRFTRALPLEAAATASFTVDIVPLAAGNITATVAASTVGDTDAGNNTDADTAFAYAPPVAAFSYDPVSGAAPLEVDFTDESTGNPVSWAWDIDDSGGAPDYTTQNPTHIYAAPDTYTVRLTVTNPAGSDDVTHDVVVS